MMASRVLSQSYASPQILRLTASLLHAFTVLRLELTYRDADGNLVRQAQGQACICQAVLQAHASQHEEDARQACAEYQEAIVL